MPRRAPALVLAAALAVPAVAASTAATAATAPVPVWARQDVGRSIHSSPTIADVDGDGENDIVVGSLDGYVRVLRSDGAVIGTWPVDVGGPGLSAVDSSPTVADLDGDGANEVIVGAGSTFVAGQSGGLVVFNRDGSVRFRIRTADVYNVWADTGRPDGLPEGVFATAAVGDVDGDGLKDVVFASWDHNVYAVDRNGSMIPGFPFRTDDTIWSSPALYDLDGDGRMEIFLGGDSACDPVCGPGGVFWGLKWTGDSVGIMWRNRVGEAVMSSPAIGDIDGDGRPEAVVGAGIFFNNADSRKVWAWHLDDGSLLPGWPRETGGETFGSPALGDVTGDDGGVPEVVMGSRDGKVYAWRGDGRTVWVAYPNQGTEPVAEMRGSPVIADIDGNGTQDVVVSTGYAGFGLRGSDGARLLGPLDSYWAFWGTPAVGKFRSGWRLVTYATKSAVIGGVFTITEGRVASWAISSAVNPAWPQFHHDAAHSGSVLGSVTAPVPPFGYWMAGADGKVYAFGKAPFAGSAAGLGLAQPIVGMARSGRSNGYWLVATDGGIFSFGGAQFYGSTGDIRLNQPIVGIASTPTGRGYWMVASDGGIFSFGDAQFHGSTGDIRLNQPIVGMASTPTGGGYWLVASDGGIFTFGDARFLGSTGDIRLNQPVVGMATHPNGYWMVARDGGIFSFGTPFYGSTGDIRLNQPIIAMAPAPAGDGYWMVASDGGIFAFGNVGFVGSLGGTPLSAPVVGFASAVVG